VGSSARCLLPVRLPLQLQNPLSPPAATTATFISFDSPALLFKVPTQKRWELLSAMTGAGPMSLRGAARRVERDVEAVHGDVHALLAAGILQKIVKGRIVVPFDAVRVEFLLRAA
jgi:predicted transcriptional regulator